jgi:murein DD-endopeptidase MepM/ murein hydrolase activator NlpD
MALNRRTAIGFFILAFALMFSAFSDAAARKSAKKSHAKERRYVRETKILGTHEVSLFSSTRVRIPKNYTLAEPRKLTFYGKDFTLHVYARSFMRGEAAYCELVPQNSALSNCVIELDFENSTIPLTKKRWGFRGIFAIPPDSDMMWASLNARLGNGENFTHYHFPIKIFDLKFEVYKKKMSLGEYSDGELFQKKPELKERIEKEKEKKQRTFSRVSEDYLRSRLSHPRDHHRVTSTFYAKRMYERYEMKNGSKQGREPIVSHHYGTDLWGSIGSPVYAIADGKVVLCEEMFYEGNQVIIDHGAGIFSRYMHLSEMRVHMGQKISAGDLLGKVGATGMATGPHVHVGLLIRGVYVDPMSILSLPIRDD